MPISPERLETAKRIATKIATLARVLFTAGAGYDLLNPDDRENFPPSIMDDIPIGSEAYTWGTSVLSFLRFILVCATRDMDSLEETIINDFLNDIETVEDGEI